MRDAYCIDMTQDIDISENELLRQSPRLLKLLLWDRTRRGHIFWATEDYASLGRGYRSEDRITVKRITGKYGDLIQPRALKTRAAQLSRTKERAEVFTPSWVCNAQNNIVDEAWFECGDVFNIEHPDTHTWTPTESPITFPEGKTWQDYLRAVRMEITCGEAPYLVSRYDTTTGRFIPLPERIGMLDRKMRVLAEQALPAEEWLSWAQVIYQSIYAFEWQGDNLLLAREALLISFVEYHAAQFGERPSEEAIEQIAEIISWNIWQMDGLRGVVPNSCKPLFEEAEEFLDEDISWVRPCPGCAQGNVYEGHTGIYCKIRDWSEINPRTGLPGRPMRFVDLLKHTN